MNQIRNENRFYFYARRTVDDVGETHLILYLSPVEHSSNKGK